MYLLKELGRFVRNITPEMIHRIVRYVDEDRNGTIDIAELDKAFRLSRWQIDEAIEGWWEGRVDGW